MRTLSLLAAALAVGLSGVSAQIPSGTPLWGSVTLGPGFAPDPHRVTVAAGGLLDASRLGPGCVGHIGATPDFNLTYTGGGTQPLYILATSTADISLVVNRPDGSWACDDDSGDELNPMLLFGTPQTGLYNIWFGNVGGSLGDIAPATLSISQRGVS